MFKVEIYYAGACSCEYGMGSIDDEMESFIEYDCDMVISDSEVDKGEMSAEYLIDGDKDVFEKLWNEMKDGSQNEDYPGLYWDFHLEFID